jgi:hypothetical protein
MIIPQEAKLYKCSEAEYLLCTSSLIRPRYSIECTLVLEGKQSLSLLLRMSSDHYDFITSFLPIDQ